MIQFYLKTLNALLYLVIPLSTYAQYNNGDSFTANTAEGVEMIFKVISNTEKTCQVGTGTINAINSEVTGTISIPRIVNGYTVSVIGSKAFQNCALSKVKLTEAITSIQSDAFRSCANLSRIDFPPSVKSIGSSAFKGCSQLDDVRSFIDTPFDIDEDVFQNISSGASLEVLYGTKEKYMSAIGWNVFSTVYADNAYIDGIRYSVNGAVPEEKGDPYTAWVHSSPKWTVYAGDVKIPSTLTIGNEVFTVIGIDDGAFEGSQITSVIIPNTIKRIDGGAFYQCTGLASITIPNSVTGVNSSAFYGCIGLVSVTIGNSVTSIGSFAFYGCSGLTSIVSLATTPPTCTTYDDFKGVDKQTCKLFVPTGSKAAYQNADVWKDFSLIEEGAETMSVTTTKAEDRSTRSIYSIDGKRVDGPKKGLNIIRMSDGTVKKVMVK